MPLPATHLQSVQTAVKMATASDLSLRGGRRPTWQSREGSYVFADGFPVIRHCPARFPRRFAPRDDTSGWCSGTPVPLYSLISPHKALTTRKGHAASVRRQSRQRLRRERRYRRNRSVRFYRHLARTGSAFPRLPRRFAPRNDTSGSAAVHQCPPAVEWLCTRRSLPARGTPHP